MPEFPPRPVSPAELLERFLPAAFAEREAPAAVAALAMQLGVRLEGEGGGEWLVDLADGKVSVRHGARDGAAFSYVQSVEDWRGALWEGRGSWAGKGAAALFRPAEGEALGAIDRFGGLLPVALAAMREVEGLLQLAVSDPEGDWKVGLLLGPGQVPTEPTTVVQVAGEDLDQMVAGELKPMEAFMAGRIRVTGDMALLLRLQAAGMEAFGELGGEGVG